MKEIKKVIDLLRIYVPRVYNIGGRKEQAETLEEGMSLENKEGIEAKMGEAGQKEEKKWLDEYIGLPVKIEAYFREMKIKFLEDGGLIPGKRDPERGRYLALLVGY